MVSFAPIYRHCQHFSAFIFREYCSEENFFKIHNLNNIDKFIFFSFEGHDLPSIFEGGVFVDLSFPSIGRNGNKMDQLDDNKKKDIENVLNDEFCNLDVESQAQSKICSIQNLDFRVQKRISCGTLNFPNLLCGP